jgi:hypothetical protein
VKLLELYVSVVFDLAPKLVKHLLVVGPSLAEELRLVLGNGPQVHVTLKDLLKVLNGCKEKRGRKKRRQTHYGFTISNHDLVIVSNSPF